jgi:hypothetical protein
VDKRGRSPVASLVTVELCRRVNTASPAVQWGASPSFRFRYPEGGRLFGVGGFFIPRRYNVPSDFLFQLTEILWLVG